MGDAFKALADPTRLTIVIVKRLTEFLNIIQRLNKNYRKQHFDIVE